jgi:hypothetical protein
MIHRVRQSRRTWCGSGDVGVDRGEVHETQIRHGESLCYRNDDGICSHTVRCAHVLLMTKRELLRLCRGVDGYGGIRSGVLRRGGQQGEERNPLLQFGL